MRGSAGLPAVVPARTPRPERTSALSAAVRLPAAGRPAHREPGHRRSASGAPSLLLLLLPPGHLLRAEPRRAAPATRTQPQTPATHPGHRPRVPPFSGFLPRQWAR